MLISEFHFIRPYWFIALVPVGFILWRIAKHHLINKHWESVCDPELLPYILIGKPGKKNTINLVLTIIVSLIIVIALAGPTWKQLPQPVFQTESALVIALDLSLSMYADDIKPSRLERARYKISDLLNLRDEGQTALLVYAADAFVVTPLTDDVKTINSQLPALSPVIMPAPGSNTASAIDKASELLKQAGIKRGHILLVSDEIDDKYINNFIEAKNNGYPVSILGVGTKEGAPVRIGDGSFLEDRSGTIVIPQLEPEKLSRLSNVGGGYYETSQIADGDIERLNRLFNSKLDSSEESKTEFKSDQWDEFGPWLVLIILPIVALSFRRGYLVILVSIMINHPDDAMAFEWEDLWLNKNQQALRALEKDKADVASELFQDNEWKAAAKYRSGDYAATEEILNKYEDNRNLYNKANSLAKQGRYEDAIDAYDKVLENDPEHQDAKFNKELVEKELEKQQQQQQSDSDQKSEESDKNNQSEQQDSNSENNQQQSQSESKQEKSEQKQSSKQGEQEDEGKSESAEQQQAENDKQQQDKKSKELKQQEEKSKEKQQQVQQATNELDEDQQASEQWLRRIPDDPSGLLRRKFKYQYQQQKRKQATNEKYW